MKAAVNKDKCTGCGQCADICPVEAINIDDNTAEVLREECIGCGICVDICPFELITLEPDGE